MLNDTLIQTLRSAWAQRVSRTQQTDGSGILLLVKKTSASDWEQVADLNPFDQAEKYFTSAIAADSGVPSSYVMRGTIRAQRDNYDLALSDYDEAIEVDPGDALAFCYRGIAWSAKGNHDKPIADFDEALRLSPSSLKRTTTGVTSGWLEATMPRPRWILPRPFASSPSCAGVPQPGTLLVGRE